MNPQINLFTITHLNIRSEKIFRITFQSGVLCSCEGPCNGDETRVDPFVSGGGGGVPGANANLSKSFPKAIGRLLKSQWEKWIVSRLATISYQISSTLFVVHGYYCASIFRLVKELSLQETFSSQPPFFYSYIFIKNRLNVRISHCHSALYQVAFSKIYITFFFGGYLKSGYITKFIEHFLNN